jgi:hypothetical protein
MRFRTLGSFASASVMLLLAQTALQADPITFDFTGYVSSVHDPFGLVGSLIETGDPVLASLRYDTATPDFYPADPTRGTYIGSPGWLKVDIKGLDFERTSSVQVDVLHGFVADVLPQELLQAAAFDGVTAWPAQLPTFTHSEILMFIGQTTPPFSLFSSDALPSSIDLSKADRLSGFVRSGTQELNMYEVQFALSPGVVVPEPRTLAPLAGGLLLICLTHPAILVRRNKTLQVSQPIGADRPMNLKALHFDRSDQSASWPAKVRNAFRLGNQTSKRVLTCRSPFAFFL